MDREKRPLTTFVVNSVDGLVNALEGVIDETGILNKYEAKTLIEDFISRYNAGKAT